jgi:hypothetical protein
VTSPLPPLYTEWMRQALDSAVPPTETRATCSSCAMCEGPTSPPRAVPAFSPSVTCCTYIPTLSNVAVGRILLGDDTLGGRSSVIARIGRHVAVTPLGLGWPHAQSELYKDTEKHFGRHEGLRCPHYVHTKEGGRCGIWRDRNATCATWFCKHDRGATGRRVWMAIRDLLGTVDAQLAWHTVDALGISVDRRERLAPRPGLLRGYDLVDGHRGPPTPAHREAVWGRWLGREHAFYKACAQHVEGYRWNDIQRIVGGTLDAPIAAVAEAIAALSAQKVPNAPVRGNVTQQIQATGQILVSGYSTYDSLVLSAEQVTALNQFDGAPLTLVRHRLQEHGVDIDDATLLQWLDAELLLPHKDTR